MSKGISAPAAYASFMRAQRENATKAAAKLNAAIEAAHRAETEKLAQKNRAAGFTEQPKMNDAEEERESARRMMRYADPTCIAGAKSMALRRPFPAVTPLKGSQRTRSSGMVTQ